MNSFKRRQSGVQRRRRRIDARDMRVGQHLRPREAKRAAEIEQIVLNKFQRLSHALAGLVREDDADPGIQLVHLAEQCNARI